MSAFGENRREAIVRTGLATSRGCADGPVFLYCADRNLVVPEYVVNPEAIDQEIQRYQQACLQAKQDLESLIAKAETFGLKEDARSVFANHLAMVDDVTVHELVEKYIREGVNAEAALRRGIDFFRNCFAKMDDPYLRERVRDVDDLEHRLLGILLGGIENSLSQITVPSVIVADDLTPSETVALPRDLILAIVTNRGSTTSHVALLARTLGIPAVVGLENITSLVSPGDRILVDGEQGLVTIRPTPIVAEAFQRHAARGRAMERIFASTRHDPGGLRDGTPLKLVANVQPGMPFDALSEYGAQGVGLYRTEYLWMESQSDPDEDRQFAVYAQAVRTALPMMGPDARLTFRCLDLGGDKLMRGVKSHEENPFLGYRSIRWLLGHRESFRTQLRAILRAAALGKTAVLFPMIATRDELRAANAELDTAMTELRMRGVDFDAHIMRGAMIETPAAAMVADQLAHEVDFFSIGTNDLVQYTLAADRGNAQVAYLSKPADPSIVRLIDRICQCAKAGGIYACICGEAASDPILAPLWAGLGIKVLSMSPSCIPVIKTALKAVSLEEVQMLAEKVRVACADASADDIRAICRDFMMTYAPELPL